MKFVKNIQKFLLEENLLIRHQNEATKSLGVFGPVDVGQGVYWWDYGQLRLYQQYALMMTDK